VLEGLPPELLDLTESRLLRWVEAALAEGRHDFGRGYQGRVLLFEQAGRRLIVKVPPQGRLGWFYRAMLRHEYRVYRCLHGFEGVPRCYGLPGGRYLVLEHIEGVSLRERRPEKAEIFFKRLLELLQRLHAAGVTHVDLKKKDNILIVNGETPYLVDFGVAIIRKPGWRPVNRYLFVLGKRFDLNAWVKHKYRKDYGRVSVEDRMHLDRSWVETWAHKAKYAYKKLKKRRRDR
jgi:predicted Ser/Thr protein kinase